MTFPLSGRRLLVLSEDAGVARLVAAVSIRLGAGVQAVANGRAALEALARGGHHAAVLDLPVADLGAEELLGACGRAGAAAVIVSAVYRGAQARDMLFRLGARELLEKPLQVEALARALAQAMGTTARRATFGARAEVTGSVPLPEPAPSRPNGPAPPPARRGELSRASVPRVLVALHLGQATGALTLARGPVRKVIVLDRGAPVHAASNVPAERLGALCVRRGLVTAERLEAIRSAARGARTGDALEAEGVLTPRQRTDLVAGQLRAIAWSTFEWRDGGYAFEAGRPPAGHPAPRLDPGELVLEGIRRTATLPRLREELPADAHLAPAPDPAFELHALRLLAPEARLLVLADGTKRTADLVRLADMAERDALAFLQACRVLRLLDEVERGLASTRRIGFM